jgi:hypothetical protein
MIDEVQALDERIDRLEEAMSREVRVGLDMLHDRIDVLSETMETKMQIVIERVDALAGEIRARAEAIRREHQADRQLRYSISRGPRRGA